MELDRIEKEACVVLERYERLRCSNNSDTFKERPKASLVYEEHDIQVIV